MSTIRSLVQTIAPLAATASPRDVTLRFRDDATLQVLPILDDTGSVVLITRSALDSASSLLDLLTRPTACVALEASLQDALRVLSEAPGTPGLVVQDANRYHGFISAASLVQAAIRDLDEQQLALADSRAHAFAAARAKNQFLAIMSHELRTPMNGVLAIAELLRRQPLSPTAQTHVQTIIASSDTLLRILQDAVDLSRAEAGELDLASEPVNLHELMTDVGQLWASRASQDGITLVVGFEGDTDLAAEIDPARLKQVFGNLIGNALKFARQGLVEASLKAELIDGQVRLQARVRDNGPGIDPARTTEIFQPFVHGSGPDGAGLGLSICRQIVEHMGGRIWAGNNDGRGATFAFEMTAPAARIEAAPTDNIAALADLELQAHPHVLIVDDNATNRIVAQALCEMFGCTSETVEDGHEALDAVQSRPFDLVLMDIKMPRMDGMQATTAIRKLPAPMGRLPIVALTANADPDDAQHYLSLGMAAVVEKPIKPERLRMAMNLALAAGAQETGSEPVAIFRAA